ncbi:hypothetical protein LOD99_11251 [Oopsacas minuta]|uniref:Uncharacterized protein n=1 Tax=Oopsacas minuta TaxID=111878 RepID=A0AAV7K7K4_9METZ|nr:hypothetical protein LOD99_11251 [Oopsacas minuta]
MYEYFMSHNYHELRAVIVLFLLPAAFAKPTKAGYVFADDLDYYSYNHTILPLIVTQVTPYFIIISGRSDPIPSDPSLSPLPPASPIPYASDSYFTDHLLCPAYVIDDW